MPFHMASAHCWLFWYCCFDRLCILYSSVSGIVSAAIYGFCLIFLYLMSTIYHAITNSTAKKIFQVLDHCSIFLLILGSYVPICIVLLPPELGWKLLGINLLLTVVGITLNAISLSRWEKLSLLMYVLMGWSVLLLCRICGKCYLQMV